MIIRKNVRSLSPQEKEVFVNALLELKHKGEYDKYVHWHHHVMSPTVFPYEPRDANSRNGAHRGAAFLPWHREFLMQLEQELRSINFSISIPYWDWTEDASLPDPTTAPIWSEDFMGGNGLETDEWRIQSGVFAYKNGKWDVPRRSTNYWDSSYDYLTFEAFAIFRSIVPAAHLCPVLLNMRSRSLS